MSEGHADSLQTPLGSARQADSQLLLISACLMMEQSIFLSGIKKLMYKFVEAAK